jgi:hypothetical protein
MSCLRLIREAEVALVPGGAVLEGWDPQTGPVERWRGRLEPEGSRAPHNSTISATPPAIDGVRKP